MQDRSTTLSDRGTLSDTDKSISASVWNIYKKHESTKFDVSISSDEICSLISRLKGNPSTEPAYCTSKKL